MLAAYHTDVYKGIFLTFQVTSTCKQGGLNHLNKMLFQATFRLLCSDVGVYLGLFTRRVLR